MTETLLAPGFLFRYSIPLKRCDPIWSGGDPLPSAYRLPCFGELEGRPHFADVRGAWSEQGLTFTVIVEGKKQTPWCREARPDESDGVQVWIDTRDTHNVHRASRFCHRFFFLPRGGGRGLSQPCADQMVINRARENAKTIPAGALQVAGGKPTGDKSGGYVLSTHIPAECLTGFDPREHPKLGFSYAVIDRELGWQTFSVGPEFPFMEDPSLWGTLVMSHE